MFVAFSLPHFTKNCQSKEVKEGEENIAVDVIDALIGMMPILANEKARLVTIDQSQV